MLTTTSSGTSLKNSKIIRRVNTHDTAKDGSVASTHQPLPTQQPWIQYGDQSTLKKNCVMSSFNFLLLWIDNLMLDFLDNLCWTVCWQWVFTRWRRRRTSFWINRAMIQLGRKCWSQWTSKNSCKKLNNTLVLRTRTKKHSSNNSSPLSTLKRMW